MKIFTGTFFIFILISNLNCQQNLAPKELQISYIANEGFLISCDDKKILIDAIFKSKNYTSPSDNSIEKILKASPPFDNVGYLLVTHEHKDHFDAKLTSEFLAKNSKTKFISTSESCNKLSEIGFNSPQLNCLNPELGETKVIIDNDITITALRLIHGTSADINNLAFIIQFGDFTVMHMGDAFVLQSEEYLKKINWGNYNVDVLFVGYLDVNQFTLETLNNTIKPKNLVMMHIHEEDIQEAKDRNNQYNANAIIFEKELESKTFNK